MSVRSCLALFFSLFFTGCHQLPLTYEFLMQHPDIINKEFTHCQNESTSASCDLVQQAAKDFLLLSEERANDPLAFGKKIRDAQMVLMNLSPQSEAYRKQENEIKILYAVVVATSPAN